MREVASAVPPLAGQSAERFARAYAELGAAASLRCRSGAGAGDGGCRRQPEASREASRAAGRRWTRPRTAMTDEPQERATTPPIGSEAEARSPSAGRGRDARGRCRGLRRAARPAAGHGAHAEGRPCQDLGAGAGAAISGFHHRGAPAQARDRRRLSRHGGVACFSQVEALVAGGAERRGRAERRGACPAARLPAASVWAPCAMSRRS